MPKNKLQRFKELNSFSNTYQYLHFDRGKDHSIKGKWSSEVFKNNHPIILELGCGKAEYTIALGEKYKNTNFIGVDLKGDRIWRGAKTALEKNLPNVAFLRSQIDFIEHCFAKDEISEIWITFPDPQKEKARKRLTHPIFLNRYKNILKVNGLLHLKTDSLELHEYTLEVIRENCLITLDVTNHLYGRYNASSQKSELDHLLTEVQTTYEKKFLAIEKNITYIRFRFP